MKLNGGSAAGGSQVDDLFAQLACENAEGRLEKLHGLCRDSQVRERVMLLLCASDKAKAAHWLEVSPLVQSSDSEVETATLDIDDTSLPETSGLPADSPSWRAGGTRRIGKYRISRLLGSGGFANVFLAYDTVLAMDVALKVPNRPLTSDGERSEFLKEARALMMLDHPHIAKVFNADTTADGQAYIAIEFVDGMSLRDYIERHPDMDIVDIAHILAPVAEAMSHAHTQSLVHRDLKPANILIDNEGNPKVTDFGLAIRDDIPHRRGELAGTLTYMAPEQIRRDTHDLDGRADIWALGVILYEMLTGGPPFRGSRAEIQEAVLDRTPKPPRQIRPGIPSALESLCLECLAKDVSGRPSSILDVARRLRRVIAPRRRRILLIAGGALAFFAATGGAGLFLGRERTVDSIAVPGEWTSLLRRKPKILSMAHQRVAVTQVAPLEPVSLDSQARLLVQLDETSQEEFTVEMAFRKSQWAGRFGIFWGYRPVPYAGQRCFTANAVLLDCYSDAPDTGAVRIACYRWVFIPSPSGHASLRQFPSGPPTEMDRRLPVNDGIFRLTVSRERGVTMRWQNRPVRWAGPLAFETHRGAIGCVNENGATVLHRADFLLPLVEETQ